MMRHVVSVLTLACSLAASWGSGEARAQQATVQFAVRAPDNQSSFMRVYGATQPPYGFVRFCEETPDDCKADPIEESRFNATPERLSQLDDINRSVNRAIQPATDMELYGVTEYWTLPKNGKGDCEDYALLKRHMLIARGWPTGSLLMTVVRDEKGEGHAVLTARTAQGDYVLDNKTDEVKIWHKTGYDFVMRQSFLNPRVWISLDPTDGGAPAAIAGVKDKHQPTRR